MLLILALTKRYCIPFWNTKATSECVQFRRLQKAPKLIGHNCNVPWATAKRMSVSSSPRMSTNAKNLVKIGAELS